MLKIRLQRFGRKNDPAFRVVVLEGTEGPKSGSHVDQIGTYNAVTKQKSLDKEKAAYWLAKGAQPSDTVYNFLVSEGVIDGKKKNVLPSKSPIVKEQTTDDTQPTTETPAEDVPTESTDAPAEAEAAPEAPAEEAAAPEAPADVSDEALAKSEEPAPAAETPAEEAPATDVSAEASAKEEETPAA